MENLENGMEKIGSRLREIREAQHKSQSNVAQETGINQSTLSKIENENSGLTVQNLMILADYYKVSYEYLCRGTNLDTLTVLTDHIHLQYYECPYDDSQQEYLVLEIDAALLNYLFQIAQANHIPKLPDKARDAWLKDAEKEFQSTPTDNRKKAQFIPFPAEAISRDNSPNNWHQPDLLDKSNDYISKFCSDL